MYTHTLTRTHTHSLDRHTHSHRSNIPSLIATASNTWGLLILTLLLGYGLVEVPRTLLNASRLSYTLKHCYFRAAKLYVDLAEANDKLQEVTEVSTVERGREVTEVREGGREVTEVSTVEREGGSCRYTVEPPNKGHIGSRFLSF